MESNTTRKKPKRTRLLRPELIVLLSMIVVCALAAALDVPLRTPLQLYVERVIQAALLYGTGLLLHACCLRLQDIQRGRSSNPPRRIPFRQSLHRARRRFAPQRVAFDLRLVHAVSLSFVVFIQMKHMTLALNSSRYDQWFSFWESEVFGGRLAANHVATFFGSTSADAWSSVYTAFYPFLALFIYLSASDRSHHFAERASAAFVLVWIVGALLIWVVPTLGPCFASPELLLVLPATPVTELQSGLLRGWESMGGDVRSPRGLFLISGFPSLHCAVPLLALSLFRVRRPAFAALSAVFFGATVISTLYFGWHYVLDDLGAIPVVVAALFLAPKTSPTTAKRIPCDLDRLASNRSVK